MTLGGTRETKDFYDDVGWVTSAEGVTADRELFGVRQDGPIRVAIHERKWARIAAFASACPENREIIEVGCGGAPEPRLMTLFDRYTGTDFSTTGLDLARQVFAGFSDRVSFVTADAVALPFHDASFDAVYSAHMLYHIADPAAQAAALGEMVRVLRPGGCLILQTANPRPLLFPARYVTRLVADTQGLGQLARRIKGPSPLPYNPQKLSWTRAKLDGLETVEIITGNMASTAFNQSVNEEAGLGKRLWTAIDHLDRRFPHLAARLGNYAVVLGRKAAVS